MLVKKLSHLAHTHIAQRRTMWHQQSLLELTMLLVLGKTRHQKRRSGVERESLGEGEQALMLASWFA